MPFCASTATCTHILAHAIDGQTKELQVIQRRHKGLGPAAVLQRVNGVKPSAAVTIAGTSLAPHAVGGRTLAR